mmetsp:Transcript_15125/g.35671  ORF Transcript_15125/g.35671 Transcript_15125/m.35671 type:complete len:225 (-) Transcript_15125:199-873(-)
MKLRHLILPHPPRELLLQEFFGRFACILLRHDVVLPPLLEDVVVIHAGKAGMHEANAIHAGLVQGLVGNMGHFLRFPSDASVHLEKAPSAPFLCAADFDRLRQLATTQHYDDHVRGPGEFLLQIGEGEDPALAQVVLRLRHVVPISSDVAPIEEHAVDLHLVPKRAAEERAQGRLMFSDVFGGHNGLLRENAEVNPGLQLLQIPELPHVLLDRFTHSPTCSKAG